MTAAGVRKARAAGSLFRTVLLVLASLVVGFVLMEIGWRVYLHQTGRGFFDNPNDFISPWFTMWDEPRPFITPTGYQYRNGSVAVAKPEKELRVICFGGSTTANLRAGISYPELLETKFAGEGNGYVVRVLNAGSEGFSGAHTLVNFSLRNLDAQPDIITVYENINDLSAAWFGDLRPDYANKYLDDSYLALRHRTGLLAAFSRVSRLARFLVSRISAIEYPTYAANTDADYSQALVYFRRNLRSIVAVAKANGIRVVLVTQPAKSNFRDHAGFTEYNRAIAELAASEGVDLVDVAAVVTDDRYFLADAIHNNREGVMAVAEALFPKLNEVVDQVAGARGLDGVRQP